VRKRYYVLRVGAHNRGWPQLPGRPHVCPVYHVRHRRTGISGRAVCILLVEDEPLLLMMTEAVLHDAGYEVMAAGHGPDALNLIAENPGRFIALITDYAMPLGMVGTDIIEQYVENIRQYP
jgi:PleD family two-component response regulator